MLALSSMILRIRPLVVLSKKPSGSWTSRFMATRRISVSTRNAAKCESVRAKKIDRDTTNGCTQGPPAVRVYQVLGEALIGPEKFLGQQPDENIRHHPQKRTDGRKKQRTG